MANHERLDEPMLAKQSSGRKRQSLKPVFVIACLNTTAHFLAHTPAFSLRFHELALKSGLDAGDIAAAVGGLTALRSLVELCSTPMLARWSDRVGRRMILRLCCTAYCVEFVLLANARSVVTLGSIYIAGGVLASHNAIEGSCVVDATTSLSRSGAFGTLFVALGLAFVLGPALGGELTSREWEAPFMGAAGISALGLLCALFWMPEYLPNSNSPRRSESSGSTGYWTTLKAFTGLVLQDSRLPWYLCSSSLCSLGISAFLSVRTVWVHELFGMDGRAIGRVVSTYGMTLVCAQFILLPILLMVMQGRTERLAQLCLLIHTARFTAYGFAPSSDWIYTTLILSSAGSCSVPLLQALCSRCVVEEEQPLLSGGASALNTAMQVLGSLIGSQVFAASLKNDTHRGAHLLVCAFCCGLAATCLVPVMCLDGRSAKRKDEPPSWLTRAEGMHGMDASLPSPTARGSMLFRSGWLRSRARERAGP